MNLKRFFINTIVCVLILISVVYITSQPEGEFESAKNFLSVTFKENFQFYKISETIEKNYGTISAFLPIEFKKNDDESATVSGKILPPHREVDGGFIVGTENGVVSALEDGVVTFVGKKESDGVDIEVELGDGSSVSYSQLESANVRTYQHVQKGDFLGTSGSSGEYLLQGIGAQGLLK